MIRSLSFASILVVAAALLAPLPAVAQEPQEGVNTGNYNVKQTLEFGGRIKNNEGNGATYRTYLNLNSGPRLFEYTVEMRSLNHQGIVFDNLYFTNFGYGGDPNNVSRLRIYKNRWYDFSATFRRDRIFWDYNLLANPINPNVPVANAPPGFSPVVTISPHRTETVRRMSDFNLTILPQSPLRFRLGYVRNVSEGPSYTSFHEGTDVLLFQDWKTTLNSYQLGVDFRVLPRTSISFDQFFHAYKGDTSWENRNQNFLLSDGVTPVDIGLPINTAANQPCAAPFVATPAGTVNPTCNGYLTYTAVSPIRTDYPTSRLSLQSSYFKNFDFSARAAYSSADSDMPIFDENFTGLITRTRQSLFNITGPSQTKRVTVTADFAATWEPVENLRLMDTFHFNYFRLPGRWSMTEASLFSTSMLIPANIFTPGPAPPATCPTITSPGCPQHTTNSPADVISGLFSLYLGENSKTNQVEVAYDFNSHFGGRIGYRFRSRAIRHRSDDTEDMLFFPTLPNRGACAGQPLLPDGSCQVTVTSSSSEAVDIHENSALLGAWFRNHVFRTSFAMEIMSADNTFTRISPRELYVYKIRATYKPVGWATISGAINLYEVVNDQPEVEFKNHNRTYGFSVIMAPDENWSLDFGYDFNDIDSAVNICYTVTPRPPGASPCPSASALISGVSFYTNDVHFGHFDFMFKPHPRVMANVGYTVTSTDGNTTLLAPNPPLGPLRLDYHQPRAQVIVDLRGGFSWRAEWNYHSYEEKAPPDPTGPRDFRTNLVTLSIRYTR
jgi:hypothetical protein